MCHEECYKQGIFTSAACVTSDSSEDRDEELTMTCSVVVELKTSGRATKQLYA